MFLQMKLKMKSNCGRKKIEHPNISQKDKCEFSIINRNEIVLRTWEEEQAIQWHAARKLCAVVAGIESGRLNNVKVH